MSDYPKFMYRHHPLADVVDRLPCEILHVLDADEEKAAKSDGWHDSVAAAAPDGKAGSDDGSSGDTRVALRAEYKALSGKNAFGGWSAEVLAEKIAALNA